MSVFEFWSKFREGIQLLRTYSYGTPPVVYVRTKDGNEYPVSAVKVRAERMILEIDSWPTN